MAADPRRARWVLGVCAATMLVLLTHAAAVAAPAHETASKPLYFEGRFTGRTGGAGSIWFRMYTFGPLNERRAVQALGGAVPAICVNAGRTLIDGRDGQIQISFTSFEEGSRVPTGFEVPRDGRFARRLEHRATVSNSEAYSLNVRGRFTATTVSGRVQGTSSDSFSGKCRASRTFTAKLKKP